MPYINISRSSLIFSAPYHPHTNDQVEATNKTLWGTLKKRLDDAKRN